jgi:hypothetical protein
MDNVKKEKEYAVSLSLDYLVGATDYENAFTDAQNYVHGWLCDLLEKNSMGEETAIDVGFVILAQLTITTCESNKCPSIEDFERLEKGDF